MEVAERWAGVGHDSDIQTCSYRGQHPLLNPLPEGEEAIARPSIRDQGLSDRGARVDVGIHVGLEARVARVLLWASSKTGPTKVPEV